MNNSQYATTAAGSSIKQNKYGDSIPKKSKANPATFYSQNKHRPYENMEEEEDQEAETINKGREAAYDTQEEIDEQ
jgi:hypothetical protein